MILHTKKGDVTIRSFYSPEEIRELEFRNPIYPIAGYRPLVKEKESLIKAAARPDANVTLAVTGGKHIVGFAILEYPREDDRWVRLGPRLMMEVSMIEVNRLWRSQGLSKALLRDVMNHPLKEEKICYMVGYAWTWDLAGTGMEPLAYRDMLVRLFSSHAFKIFQTNEPNVMMRPENLFMARIGVKLSKAVQTAFKHVRFDMDRIVSWGNVSC